MIIVPSDNELVKKAMSASCPSQRVYYASSIDHDFTRFDTMRQVASRQDIEAFIEKIAAANVREDEEGRWLVDLILCRLKECIEKEAYNVERTNLHELYRRILTGQSDFSDLWEAIP